MDETDTRNFFFRVIYSVVYLRFIGVLDNDEEACMRACLEGAGAIWGVSLNRRGGGRLEWVPGNGLEVCTLCGSR